MNSSPGKSIKPGQWRARRPPPTAVLQPSSAEARHLLACQRAFSLLELLVVMTLIGLLTAVAVPNFGRSLAPLQARSSANKITALLRYARSQAVTRQQACRVLFDIPEHRVAMLSSPTSPAAGPPPYRLPADLSVQFSGQGAPPTTDEAFTINFYPGGNSSGGEINLSGKTGRVYRIKVDFITGITEVL